VESSYEFCIEPSGSVNCLGNYQVSKQLGISRVVLSSMELVSWLGSLGARGSEVVKALGYKPEGRRFKTQ
jgi:hypothetical protein